MCASANPSNRYCWYLSDSPEQQGLAVGAPWWVQGVHLETFLSWICSGSLVFSQPSWFQWFPEQDADLGHVPKVMHSTALGDFLEIPCMGIPLGMEIQAVRMPFRTGIIFPLHPHPKIRRQSRQAEHLVSQGMRK